MLAFRPRSLSPFPVLALLGTATACGGNSTGPAEFGLRHARDLWRQAAILDYSITVERRCVCDGANRPVVVQVSGGAAGELLGETSDRPLGGEIGYKQLHRLVSARFGDLRPRNLATAPVSADHRHRGASDRQGQGGRLSDPGVGPGHETDLGAHQTGFAGRPMRENKRVRINAWTIQPITQTPTARHVLV